MGPVRSLFLFSFTYAPPPPSPFPFLPLCFPHFFPLCLSPSCIRFYPVFVLASNPCHKNGSDKSKSHKIVVDSENKKNKNKTPTATKTKLCSRSKHSKTSQTTHERHNTKKKSCFFFFLRNHRRELIDRTTGTWLASGNSNLAWEKIQVYINSTKSTSQKKKKLVAWVDWLKAELSPDRYPRVPRSQGKGEEGYYTWCHTVITRMILH